jgi:hypothetical protein
VAKNTVWDISGGVFHFESSFLLPIVSSLILCLSIPILDTAHVIFARLCQRKNPFSADQNHLHHALLRLGFSHSQSVWMVYFATFVFGVFACLAVAYPSNVLSAFSLILIFVLFFMIFFFSRGTLGQFLKSRQKFFLGIRFLNASQAQGVAFFQAWERLNRALVYLVVLITPFFVGNVPQPLIHLGILMFVVLGGSFIFMKKQGFLEIFLLVVGITVVLLANNAEPLVLNMMDTTQNLNSVYNGVFILLGVSSFLQFLFTFRKKDLVITPTDFLLLSVPFFLLFLPAEIFYAKTVAVKSLILFFAIRTLHQHQPQFLRRLHVLCLGALGWLVFSG